jgi:hypothetical protein
MVANEPRLRSEEAKLQRRIDCFCSPKGLLSYFALALRRRRLLRKIRARLDVPYAMFLSLRDSCLVGSPRNKESQNKPRHDNPYQPPCFDDFP